jgi:hypothetical protein
MDTATFQAAKDSLSSAVQLAHPDPKAFLSLAVDASYSYIGAVLQQRHAAGWCPLASSPVS